MYTASYLLRSRNVVVRPWSGFKKSISNFTDLIEQGSGKFKPVNKEPNKNLPGATPLLLLFRSNPPLRGGDFRLIESSLAHRGANGAAMPTDEDDQDGHFFFNHPERGGYSAA